MIDSATRRRGGRTLIGGGCLGIFLVLVAGAYSWMNYLTYVPSQPPPLPPPHPNAADDFNAAFELLPVDLRKRLRAAPKWDQVPFPTLRTAVRTGRPALQRFRRGLTHDYAGRPLLSAEQKFPEYANYRDLARLLVAEATLAERQGKWTEAARASLDLVRMGELLRRRAPWLPNALGLAVERMGMRTLERTVEHLDDTEAVRISRAMEELDTKTTPVRATLTEERDATLRGLAELARTSSEEREMLFPDLLVSTRRLGSQPGRETTAKWWEAVTTPRSRTLARFRAYLDEEIVRLDRPYYLVGTPAPVASLSEDWRLLAEGYGNIALSCTEVQALRRILAARLALRAYQLREKHLPRSLAALVPSYLSSVPQDPFAPASLAYRFIGERPIVYSRGPDGDDDGGQDVRLTRTRREEGDPVTMPSPR